MNREIKFRAWMKEEETMIFSFNQASLDSAEFWQFTDNGIEIQVQEEVWKIEGGDPVDRLQYVKADAEIMQFTGLKDSNGVDIYEGDIILQKSNTDWHSKVEDKFIIEFGYQDLGHSSYQQTIGWNATNVRYFEKSYSKSKGIRDLCINHPGITAIVIGNIHQNKELLK